MRVMAIAVVAAVAVGALSTADAAPRKRPYVQDRAGLCPGPTTYVMHRDEQGRTRTKILVQKRSYLDGGTEVMPGDVVTNQSNLINSFYYSPSSNSVAASSSGTCTRPQTTASRHRSRRRPGCGPSNRAPHGNRRR